MALKCYLAAEEAERNGDYYAIRIGISECYSEKQNYQEAEKWYLKAVKCLWIGGTMTMDTEAERTHYSLGNFYYCIGDNANAVKYLKMANNKDAKEILAKIDES